MLLVPESALGYGFNNGPGGTHISRTIMLKELRLLLAACPRPTTYEGFRSAVVDDNALLKNTAATRNESFRRLRELYALDERTLLFRTLRDLWVEDEAGQPMLALLCSVARDATLRSTADLILSVPAGDSVTPQMIADASEASFKGRYNPTTLANIGRHAASSWQQSGHLQGRATKTRRRAHPTPAAAAYALLLGHLCGYRGAALFETLWARLLDVPVHTLQELTIQAARQGWLEYRHAGGVVEITFRHLLPDDQHEGSNE